MSNVITNVTSGPTGTSMTWTYTINSNQTANVLLGAALRSSGGTNYDIGTGFARTLTTGTGTYTITATVPAGTPAATYSLRGAVWQDVDSNGSIGGSDVLLAGPNNYNSFTVTTPLSVTLSNITTNVTSGPTGTSMTWTYTINSNQTANVLLGAALRSSGGTNYDIGTGFARTLTTGTSTYTITTTVPAGTPAATYSLRGAVWQDVDSNGSIGGSDVLLAGPNDYNSFNVVVLPSVTINNVSSSPLTATPGESLTWTYNITANQSKNVLLGASLRSAGGTNYDLTPAGGFAVALTAGAANYNISGGIPSGIPTGAYSIRASAYEDTNGNGVIDSATDLALSAAANYGSVTIDANTLGIDTYNLNGKKLGGLIHIPGVTTAGPGGQIWKTFCLRQGTTNIAKAAGDFPTFNVDAGYLVWRQMTGELAMRWTDVLTGSGPFTLKVVGLGANGTEVESAPFTFTLQNLLQLSVTASDTFPRYKNPSTPAATTFTASATGNSGTLTLTWGNALGSGTSVSAVMNTPGLNVVRCVAKDTSGNRTVEGVSVPIAMRDRCGSPNTEDGGSLAIQSTDVASGNMHLEFNDMSLPAIGIPFALTRSYNTCPASIFSPTVPTTGRWMFGFEEWISHNQINSSDVAPGLDWPTVRYGRADGSIAEFYPGLDGYYHSSTPGNHDQLVEDFNAGTFTIYSSSTPPVEKTFEITDANTRANGTYRLRSIKNLRGHGLTVFYTTANGTKISNIIDESGRPYTFYYQDADAPTRISRVSDFSGRSVYYDWDTNGNLRSFQDVRGYTTTFNYYTSGNGNKRLQSIRLPRLNFPISNIDYDAAARVTAIQMPLASAGGVSTTSTTIFNYQPSHTDVTQPGTGNNLRFGLDAVKNVTYVTESYGVANRTTNLTRLSVGDLAGQNYRANDLGLTSQSAPPSSAAAPTSLYYAPSGRGLVTQTTDGSGTTLVNYPSSIANAAPGSIPQNLALPSTITDARNKTFTPEFSGFGELSAFLNPYNQGGKVTDFDAATGLPHLVDDGRGNVTELLYTATGDLWKVIVPPDPDNANRETVFAYPTPNRGLPSTITDRKGYQTYIEWDAAGNPTLIRAVNLTPGSGETRDILMSYDENGNRTSVTDRRQKTTNTDYDAMDRPWRVLQPSPNGVATRPTSTTDFDSLGRAYRTTDPNGNIREQTFGTTGSAGGLRETTRAWNPDTASWETLQTTAYLADGRVSSVTDGEGVTRTYSYHSAPRQHLVYRISEPAPGGFQNYKEFDYDATERVIRETTGTTGSYSGHLPTKLFEYDDAGRLRRVCDVMDSDYSAAAWGKSTNIIVSVTYWGDDNIRNITDPNNHLIQHFYDAQGRLFQRLDANSSTWEFRYDANGNLHREIFPGGRTITRSFGVLDRLEGIDYGDGHTTVAYTYDANENRLGMSDPYGTSSYAYDALNRLTSFSRSPAGGRPARSLAYTHEPAGQVKSITYPGNRIVNYTHDHLGRMKTVSPWTGGSFIYSWRKDGQVDAIANPNGTSTDYQYNHPAGRLSRIQTQTNGYTMYHDYTWSPAGNILSITGDQLTANPTDAPVAMNYDDANRLSTVNGQSASVDAAGRLLSLPAPLNATFFFEGLDWLSSYTRAGQNTQYSYDGDGVRVYRATGPAVTRYLTAPGGDMPTVMAECDDSHSPFRFHIYGATGLLATADAAGGYVVPHFNHRGDTLALTRGNTAWSSAIPVGGVLESFGYSPYGLSTASNTSSSYPFRFIGQHGVMEEGNGLHFMRARYYAASVGRFVSIDRLSGSLSAAASLNRYSYAESNSLMYIDPTGFISMKESAAIIQQDKRYQALMREYEAATVRVNQLQAELELGTLEGVAYNGSIKSLRNALSHARNAQASAKGRAKAWYDAILIQHSKAERSPSINGCGPSGNDYVARRNNALTKTVFALTGVLAAFTPACNQHDVRFGSYGYSRTQANNQLRVAWESVSLKLARIWGLDASPIIAELSAAVVNWQSPDAYRAAQAQAEAQVEVIYADLLRLRSIR